MIGFFSQKPITETDRNLTHGKVFMLRVFQTDLLNTDDFIITLELVPGKESVGRSVDTVMGIANLRSYFCANP